MHNDIRLKFGQESVKLVRDLEKTTLKKPASRITINCGSRFNFHCKYHIVTPVSPKLNSCVKGEAANKILRKAKRSLLNVRIGQNSKRIQQLANDKTAPETKIKEAFPEQWVSEVKNLVSKSQTVEHFKVKERQQNNQRILGNVSHTNIQPRKNGLAQKCMERWVMKIVRIVYYLTPNSAC